MKRIALLLSITLILFAVGCAKSGDQNAAKDNQQLDVSAAPADAGSSMVYGRVDSIIGNEVVLALGEPQRGGGSSSSSADQSGAQADGEQQSGASGEQSGENPSGTSGTGQRGNWSASGGNATDGAPSGEMPSGEAPSGQMPSGEAPSGDKAAALSGNAGGTQQGGRSVSLTYSGDTATYLLPVGMAIGSGDFSDVTEGMVLSLTLDTEGTITAVSILSR